MIWFCFAWDSFQQVNAPMEKIRYSMPSFENILLLQVIS